jgi:NAD(P)-dependent dehydrogenase (short-subunit alcohol dehydrogenase family)
MTTEQNPAAGRAVIMGAKGALAEAVAGALAGAGYDIGVTTMSTDAEEAFDLRRVTRLVTKLGRRAVSEVVDMTIGTGVQVAVRQVTKELGGVDMMVVAPDLRLERPAERITDAEWARVLNSNLSAVYFACRSAFREMQNNDPPGGSIVVLAPSRGEAAAGAAAHTAARAGVEALVQTLALEWRDRGVPVNAVLLPTAGDEEARAELVASRVLWLAHEASDSVTGDLVRVEIP